jgi:hypothetical protein
MMRAWLPTKRTKGPCSRLAPATSSTLADGSLVCPRRVHAAFVRGRHTANLYDRDFNDTLLGRTVSQQRIELRLDRDTLEHPLPATVGDHLAFIGTAMLSLSLPVGLLPQSLGSSRG